MTMSHHAEHPFVDLAYQKTPRIEYKDRYQGLEAEAYEAIGYQRESIIEFKTFESGPER